MTDSEDAPPRPRKAAGKRRRLTAAAARVLHEQGVERTTIADIARAADVPAGNVYYYFKTKDELVEAALAEHVDHLKTLTDRLDRLPDPRERLKGLVAAWVEDQYRQLGAADPEGLALALVGAYQGMSLLSHALRDPEIMTREGARLIRSLDTVA